MSMVKLNVLDNFAIASLQVIDRLSHRLDLFQATVANIFNIADSQQHNIFLHLKTKQRVQYVGCRYSMNLFFFIF